MAREGDNEGEPGNGSQNPGQPEIPPDRRYFSAGQAEEERTVPSYYHSDPNGSPPQERRYFSETQGGRGRSERSYFHTAPNQSPPQRRYFSERPAREDRTRYFPGPLTPQSYYAHRSDPIGTPPQRRSYIRPQPGERLDGLSGVRPTVPSIVPPIESTIIQMEEEEEGPNLCKICLTEPGIDYWVCGCRGTLGVICMDCLESSVVIRRSRRCPDCHQEYVGVQYHVTPSRRTGFLRDVTNSLTQSLAFGEPLRPWEAWLQFLGAPVGAVGAILFVLYWVLGPDMFERALYLGLIALFVIYLFMSFGLSFQWDAYRRAPTDISIDEDTARRREEPNKSDEEFRL